MLTNEHKKAHRKCLPVFMPLPWRRWRLFRLNCNRRWDIGPLLYTRNQEKSKQRWHFVSPRIKKFMETSRKSNGLNILGQGRHSAGRLPWKRDTNKRRKVLRNTIKVAPSCVTEQQKEGSFNKMSLFCQLMISSPSLGEKSSTFLHIVLI